MIDWNAVTAIATVISMIAFVLTALYVRAELRAVEKDRYLTITNQLFAVWQTREFMDAQLWLLHRLSESSWPEFVRAHRADSGEAAFHRVGAFYDRVGTLVRLGLVRRDEILPTIGAYAIGVWQKLQPLVQEARRIEHSTLFADFERLMPACRECYVPGAGGPARPFELPGEPGGPRVTAADVADRLKRGEPLTLLDVRRADEMAEQPRTLPGALAMPEDEAERRYAELPPDRDVIVYCA